MIDLLDRRLIENGVVLQYEDSRPDRLLYKPEPKQHQLHGAHEKYILYGGAAGGMKSHSLRWHGILGCIKYANFQALLLRRTFPELEKTHILAIEKEVPEELASYNRSNHRLTFASTGSILQLGHCQDDRAWKQYLSSEWDVILVDEGSTFTPLQLARLRSRCRTTKPEVRPQYVIGSNPGGEGHLWLKQHFITKSVSLEDEPKYNPSNYLFIPALVQDNPYLDKGYIEELWNLPPAEREAYLFGNWDIFAGQFFSEWRAETHLVKAENQVEIPDWHEVEAGMDWGYDPNPGWIGYGAMDEFGRPTMYKEIVFRMLPPDAVAELLVANSITEKERNMLVRCDPSMWIRNPETGVGIAGAINSALSDMDSQIVLVRANADRINGWMRVHQYLDPRRPDPTETGKKEPWLRVYAPNPELGYGCPYLIETLPAQVHDELKPGDMKKGATDHGCDGLRYLVVGWPTLSTIPMRLMEQPSYTKRIHARTQKIMEQVLEQQNRRMEGTDGDMILEMEGEYEYEDEDEATIAGIEDLFT